MAPPRGIKALFGRAEEIPSAFDDTRKTLESISSIQQLVKGLKELTGDANPPTPPQPIPEVKVDLSNPITALVQGVLEVSKNSGGKTDLSVLIPLIEKLIDRSEGDVKATLKEFAEKLEKAQTPESDGHEPGIKQVTDLIQSLTGLGIIRPNEQTKPLEQLQGLLAVFNEAKALFGGNNQGSPNYIQLSDLTKIPFDQFMTFMDKQNEWKWRERDDERKDRRDKEISSAVSSIMSAIEKRGGLMEALKNSGVTPEQVASVLQGTKAEPAPEVTTEMLRCSDCEFQFTMPREWREQLQEIHCISCGSNLIENEEVKDEQHDVDASPGRRTRGRTPVHGKDAHGTGKAAQDSQDSQDSRGTAVEGKEKVPA